MIDLKYGDCLELMKDIPDGSVDLIVTDIPYGEVNRSSNGLRKLDRGSADKVTFEIRDLISRLVRVTSGSVYVFCSSGQVSELRSELISHGLSTRLCIWEKTNPSPMNGQKIWLSGIECCVYGKKKNATFNEHCKNTVFRYPTRPGKLHPTQKPVDLLEHLIIASSNVGDVVLDPFMGSGSTGVACVNTGRNFIGIELDKQYFDIAQKRIEESAKRSAAI